MIRRRVALLMVCCLLICSISSGYLKVYAEGKDTSKTIKVLFVGNSFTKNHKLNNIFKGLAQADGVKIKTARIAVGGYNLKKYASSKTKVGKKLRKKLKKNWDYVVIQGHSEEFITTYNAHSYKSLSRIIGLVKDSGAQPVLYMTWASTTGLKYSDRYTEYNLDREEMTQAVSDIYNRLGNEFEVKVAPVGQKMLMCSKMYPEVPIIVSDNKHPKFAGSYLAACTIYETIFDKSALGIPYYSTEEKKVGIGQKKAVKMQMVADIRLNVDKKNIYLTPNDKSKIKAEITVSDSNTKYKELYQGKDEITYTSLNPDIVKVDIDGSIEAVNPGRTYIRVSTTSGLSSITTVEVKCPEEFQLEISTLDSVYGDSYKDNLISWTSVSSGDKSEVYRSMYNGNHFKKIAETNKNYLLDKGLLRKKKYLYMIKKYSLIDDEYVLTGESLIGY